MSFEGWHEAFEQEEEALECVAFGLSAACRLRVDYRGNARDSPSVPLRVVLAGQFDP